MARDQIIGKKLRVYERKLNAWRLRAVTGGEHNHLSKIIRAKEAYIHAGLVTAEQVDTYIERYVEQVPEAFEKPPLKKKQRKDTSQRQLFDL
jgi:hypothetical protein